VQTYLYLADDLLPELEAISTPQHGTEYLEPKLGLKNKEYLKMMKGNKPHLVKDVTQNTKYSYAPKQNLPDVK
jgi:hypothetical protein